MTRKKLISSKAFWKETIENILFSEGNMHISKAEDVANTVVNKYFMSLIKELKKSKNK